MAEPGTINGRADDPSGLARTIPSVTLYTRVRDDTLEPNPYRWAPIDARDLMGTGRVVVFSMPAAFSPTCSDAHLPSAERLHDDFRNADVDRVFGLAVNDAFTMHRWGEALGIGDVQLVPDGNGDFTRRMGMLVSRRGVGYGPRSWRYAFVADDGEIVAWFEEPGIADDIGPDEDPYGVSAPERVLEWCRHNRADAFERSPGVRRLDYGVYEFGSHHRERSARA